MILIKSIRTWEVTANGWLWYLNLILFMCVVRLIVFDRFMPRTPTPAEPWAVLYWARCQFFGYRCGQPRHAFARSRNDVSAWKLTAVWVSTLLCAMNTLNSIKVRLGSRASQSRATSFTWQGRVQPTSYTVLHHLCMKKHIYYFDSEISWSFFFYVAYVHAIMSGENFCGFMWPWKVMKFHTKKKHCWLTGRGKASLLFCVWIQHFSEDSFPGFWSFWQAKVSQLPKHGFIALGRPVSVSEVAVPLPVAEPLQLNVALDLVDTTLHCVTSVCRLYFFFRVRWAVLHFRSLTRNLARRTMGPFAFQESAQSSHGLAYVRASKLLGEPTVVTVLNADKFLARTWIPLQMVFRMFHCNYQRFQKWSVSACRHCFGLRSKSAIILLAGRTCQDFFLGFGKYHLLQWLVSELHGIGQAGSVQDVFS